MTRASLMIPRLQRRGISIWRAFELEQSSARPSGRPGQRTQQAFGVSPRYRGWPGGRFRACNRIRSWNHGSFTPPGSPPGQPVDRNVLNTRRNRLTNRKSNPQQRSHRAALHQAKFQPIRNLRAAAAITNRGWGEPAFRYVFQRSIVGNFGFRVNFAVFMHATSPPFVSFSVTLKIVPAFAQGQIGTPYRRDYPHAH